jgi:hypothetical protein
MHKITQGISIFAFVAASSAAFAQTDPVAEYDEVLRQTTGLQEYNALIERQIATQERQIAELQAAIGEVPELERQIPALIERMVDGLEQFVELDLPFNEQERSERVTNMRNIVDNANVNDAEKLRRVLEAWSIENEYGREIASYSGQLPIDGVMRDVNFLQIGRIALLYQTQDQEAVGVWDVDANDFIPLGAEHRNSIRQALRMAQNAVAPDLVLIPIKWTN